jgi:hypothetical protein
MNSKGGKMRNKRWPVKALMILIFGVGIGVFVNHNLLVDVCFSDNPNKPIKACSQEIVSDPASKFKVPEY